MSLRAVCLDCGQSRRMRSRGLCDRCYRHRLAAGTLDERPLKRQRAATCCRLCGAPVRSSGLCSPHYKQHVARQHAERAGRVYVPRGPNRPRPAPRQPALALVDPPTVQPPMPAAPAGWSDWQCAGCGTHLRPRHSAGLCVDCVRAAGRLAPDPWEAAS